MRLYWSCCCVGFLYLWRVGVALYLRGSWAFHCSGFSCCRALARGSKDFSSYSPRALEHGLSSCGTQAQLLWDMWDLPGPGIEPVSPASAGRFFTTELSGKPRTLFSWTHFIIAIRNQSLISLSPCLRLTGLLSGLLGAPYLLNRLSFFDYICGLVFSAFIITLSFLWANKHRTGLNWSSGGEGW